MSASQHITWLNLVEKTGPFLAVGVLEDAFPQGLDKVETRKRQRMRSAYDEWRDAVDEEDAQLPALHREWVRLVLEELLEYEPSVLKSADALPTALTYCEPLTGAEVKPHFAVLSGDKPRLLIARYAPDTDLSTPMAGETWSASPIERMTMLCRATGVPVGLVTDGEQWTLLSVPADGSSSLGTWYARIWQQEPVTLQAFVSLLGVRRCFGPAEGALEALFARSLEHQNEVTDTLGEQVRRAVEVLVQALDRADLDRDRQLLKDVSPAQLYEAGLTVMMRLVVLLCAEERKLLLLGEPVYDQYYAVSTLRSRLREDKERLGDEVLERRHDAWARLLAVFRAVFGGIEHEMLRLPALGGSLFDPDRFPFLEGRAAGTAWRDTPALPLPIDNRTVLMLLTALQVLEQRTGALLLSYEALDVEQIGHVYEGLLERTVKRVPETTLGLIGSQKAVNPNVSLRELEETKAKGDDRLLAYLLEKTGRSESGLKNALTKKVDDALYHRVLLACGSDIPLADRIQPWALLLRTDNWGDPLAYRENSFIVTLGAGRRETGTHYTPKSLTEPIVQHTLEPLVYVGPAEGKPQAEWRLKYPPEILALKVCDMAMGSAAFLVQACRWLADRLVEAWDAAEKAARAISIEGEVLEQAGDAELLPRDKAERVLIARRLIASRCLYGVDKNPMAVELAKVSLWLITMMKGRPFSFLDHALKCGDSLLGVSSLKQIEDFSLRSGERQVTFATANLFRYVEEADKKRRELENLPSNDRAQIEAKSRLNKEAQAATAKVMALADCLVAFELRGLDGKQYDEQRAMAADHVEVAMRKPLAEFQAYAREQLRGHHPFHWPVEFPEVFAHGGFDAFIGNPPFVGGRRMRQAVGDDATEALLIVWPHASLNADLCAFFYLRVAAFVHSGGCFGLIATKTIGQGDTARTGLAFIMDNLGFEILVARSAFEWPGTAAVVAAFVVAFKGPWRGDRVLDDRKVSAISAVLDDQGKWGEAHTIPANMERSFQGSVLVGMGFVLTPEEANAFLKARPPNAEVLFPYLIGDEINTHPEQRPSRWAIDFRDRPISECEEKWPELLTRIRELVKPQRDGVRREAHRKYWWHHGDKRPALYAAIRSRTATFVMARITKFIALVQVSTAQVFQDTVYVFDLETWAQFAPLQSSIHDIWARRGSGSLGETLRYTPSDYFDTYPFLHLEARGLTAIGQTYHELRRQIMQSRHEGLTKTYNRFHGPDEQSADITRLRALHVEMDQAVAAAYGWKDLDLGHGFHPTKQGVRYTISEPARRTVLDRLLALNHQRYEEEVKAGLHDKAAKEGKGKRTKAAPENDLFG